MSLENITLSLIEKFKKNKLRFNLVPLESSSSLPVPVILNGKVFLSFLFYLGVKEKNKEKISIFRPHTKMVIDYPRGKIIQYTNLVAIDQLGKEKWKEPIGLFPHMEIESLKLKEYFERRNELLIKYDLAIEQFRNDIHDRDFKNIFRGEFYQLCEPDLFPFLIREGEPFFTWLNK